MPRTYREMLAEVAQLREAAEVARLTEKREAVAHCKELIERYGITSDDLGLTTRPPAAGVRPRPAAQPNPRKPARGATTFPEPDPQAAALRQKVLDALHIANRHAYGERHPSGEAIELSNIRRRNLAHVLQGRGIKHRLALRTSTPPARISRFLDRTTIPDRFARDTEKALRLPRGWLDVPQPELALEAAKLHAAQVIAGRDVPILELPENRAQHELEAAQQTAAGLN